MQCTRKTEVASWTHLFDVVGSPQVLFEESLKKGSLKTAGGYLLILHTMEKLSSSSKDMVRLLSIAVAQGDWDLCKELARFLVALDDTGKTLKEALELVELRSPVEEIERSFMFQSTRLMPAPSGAGITTTASHEAVDTSADGGSEHDGSLNGLEGERRSSSEITTDDERHEDRGRVGISSSNTLGGSLI